MTPVKRPVCTFVSLTFLTWYVSYDSPLKRCLKDTFLILLCSNNSQVFASWKNLRWNLNKLKLVASHRKSSQVGGQTRYKRAQAKNLRWLALSNENASHRKFLACTRLYLEQIKLVKGNLRVKLSRISVFVLQTTSTYRYFHVLRTTWTRGEMESILKIDFNTDIKIVLAVLKRFKDHKTSFTSIKYGS